MYRVSRDKKQSKLVTVFKDWPVIAVAVAYLLCCSSCEYDSQIQVTVKAGPSFELSSGRIVQFTVYAPRRGHRIAAPDAEVASVAWQIKALDDYARVENATIVYGRVPGEYKQTVPDQTQAPPPLQVGMVYSFFAEPATALRAGGYFYMDKTGPVQILVPDLCLTLINSHEVRVKCGTGEPYQEPANLEEMVQKNRIK